VQWEVEEATALSAQRERSERERGARVELANNPFVVSDEVIAAAIPDLILEAGSDGGVRATAAARSGARGVLETIPGVHYLRRDRSSFVPTHRVAELLRRCRSDRILFAVRAALGEELKGSADLRSRIVAGALQPTEAELMRAKLLPYATLVKSPGVSIQLHGMTPEALREALPNRRGRQETLTLEEFVEARWRLAWFGMEVWCERELHNFLEVRTPAWRSIVESASDNRSGAGGFPEYLLAMVDPSGCWCLDREGGGALVGPPELVAGIRQVAPDLGTLAAWRPRPSSHAITIPDSQLLQGIELIEGHLGRQLPSSEGAWKLRTDIQRRRAFIRRREEILLLSREPLPIANQPLSQKLFPHQRAAVRLLLEQPVLFIGDDMGLGKTLSVLATVDELLTQGTIGRLLVVCPSSLIKNWLREAAQWLPTRVFRALPGTKRERTEALKAIRQGKLPFDGLVINYETLRLPYVAPEVEAIFQDSNAMLCIDESQRVKNPQGKAFEVLDRLADLFPRRTLLSGTPAPKNIADIWAQMKLLDRGERLGSDYYRWLEKVAELGNEFSDYAVQRFIPEQVTEVVARVQEVLLRRKKEEVLNLPPKLFSVRDIELGGDQAKRYEEICGGLLLRLTSLDGETYTREIDSILEEYLRAVQVASNPRLVDEHWKGTPAKFEELDEIVREVVAEREEKIVIWTNYLRNVDELCERYSTWDAAPYSGQVSTADRDLTVRAFQADRKSGPRVLVAVPGAGGVGITLTAAQTAVYLDKTWNAEHWLQSVDRIHRIGQTGTVSVISLHACKVDEMIAGNLRRKSRDQERLLRGEGSSEPLHPTREELLESLRS
jgi:hypothetical protein